VTGCKPDHEWAMQSTCTGLVFIEQESDRSFHAPGEEFHLSIEIYRPGKDEVESRGILSWPIWSCEPSTFDWSYSDRETCYILEGRVTVETEEGSVSFGPGDLVVLPEGLSCVWKVEEAVRKHYRFG
jgi:uncharacterized cupin superfamily protein